MLKAGQSEDALTSHFQQPIRLQAHRSNGRANWSTLLRGTATSRQGDGSIMKYDLCWLKCAWARWVIKYKSQSDCLVLSLSLSRSVGLSHRWRWGRVSPSRWFLPQRWTDRAPPPERRRANRRQTEIWSRGWEMHLETPTQDETGITQTHYRKSNYQKHKISGCLWKVPLKLQLILLYCLNETH